MLGRPRQLLVELDRIECGESLSQFVRRAWHVIEPGTPYIHGWHIDAMCEHLEAITNGRIRRLVINVPPGTMKSSLVNVFWPAWEWGPRGMPHLRYLATSHNMANSGRDNLKMRRLVVSDWYRERWPHVRLTRDQNEKINFETTATGFRIAAAASGITGKRGDRVLIDDPHSVDSAASDAMRADTNEWFTEAVPTRLNSPEHSAIVVVMQRLHEEDITGTILDNPELGYEHLMLPMRFEADRRCVTGIGFMDPRQEDGELLFPARFPEHVVRELEASLKSYGTAGQLQQRPEPRGGGILRREWWQIWDDETALRHGVPSGAHFPAMQYRIATVDGAFTEKAENDPSAFQIWGVWKDPRTRRMHAMLQWAWADYLTLADLRRRIAADCRRFKVDRLLVENKGSGISLAQELRRTYSSEAWVVHTLDPGKLDKVARAHRVSAMLESGVVWAPDRQWADRVISECSKFPRGKHDDHVDAMVQALVFLREQGILVLGSEPSIDEAESESNIVPFGQRLAASRPLYPGVA